MDNIHFNTICTLKNLDLLHIPCNEDGTTSFGCDQDWYTQPWQRQAGCGANTASNLLLYLHKSGRITLPFELDTRMGCLALMETIWKHVTPTMMGVNSIHRFTKGVHHYISGQKIFLRCALLEYPREKADRPALSTVLQFIKQGFELDCPIAFLNLSNGDVKALDAWHWVTLVSVEENTESGHIQVTAYDGDKSIAVDLALWCETTTLEGGFVSLLKESPDW